MEVSRLRHYLDNQELEGIDRYVLLYVTTD
jgi:hypothetical protein